MLQATILSVNMQILHPFHYEKDVLALNLSNSISPSARCFIKQSANSADPDQTAPYEQSDLG